MKIRSSIETIIHVATCSIWHSLLQCYSILCSSCSEYPVNIIQWWQWVSSEVSPFVTHITCTGHLYGYHCGPGNTCCAQAGMPWLCRTLPQEVSENSEVRLCSDETLTGKDIYLHRATGAVCPVNTQEHTHTGIISRLVPHVWQNIMTPIYIACIYVWPQVNSKDWWYTNCAFKNMQYEVQCDRYYHMHALP